MPHACRPLWAIAILAFWRRDILRKRGDAEEEHLSFITHAFSIIYAITGLGAFRHYVRNSFARDDVIIIMAPGASSQARVSCEATLKIWDVLY